VFRLSFANIIQMVSSVGLSSLEISAIYTAKMTLNQIRQSNGYKDGTYVKVEDGVEDNQKLKSLVEDFIADETMTLNKLTKNVRNRFFQSKV
jgi:dUTP pyrophosphatase